MASSVPELALNASIANASLVNTSIINASLASATDAAFQPGPSSLLGLLYAQRHGIYIQSRLFALSLAVIYIGAHGALHRPFSAAPRKDEDDKHDADADDGKTKGSRRKRRRQRRSTTSESKEGLHATEAILLPFMAGLVLIGMYYLLQYMGDPLLLSRIVRTYTSVIGVASLGKLIGDGLHVATSLVFPNVWARRSADSGPAPTVFRIDPARRCQLRQQAPLPEDASPDGWTVDTARLSPFPDRLAWLARTPSSTAAAWTLRRLVREEWTVRMAVFGFGDAQLGVPFSTLAGIVASVASTAAYCFTSASSSSSLNNLLGLGFCYGGLLIVSCTTFGIGSLVLVGLFVYDIVMVFYT